MSAAFRRRNTIIRKECLNELQLVATYQLRANHAPMCIDTFACHSVLYHMVGVIIGDYF